MQLDPVSTADNNGKIIVKGPWTPDEDERLCNAVNIGGATNWTSIASVVGTRTGKQCRERWLQRLSPGLRNGKFEEWEDRIIIEQQRSVGNRWSVIAMQLNGRSPSSVKNRWYSGLRRRHSGVAQMVYTGNQDESPIQE